MGIQFLSFHLFIYVFFSSCFCHIRGLTLKFYVKFSQMDYILATTYQLGHGYLEGSVFIP